MGSGPGTSPLCGRAFGWLFLAAVLDLFSRRVIGWAIAACQDQSLDEAALPMALFGRIQRPACCLMLIADRSTKVDGYRALLVEAKITASMSRTANCDDHAVTESCLGTRHARRCETRLLPDTRTGQTSDLRVPGMLL